MLQVDINSDPFQEIIIPFEDQQILLTLRFLPVVQIWIMNITFRDTIKIIGVKLSLGTFHIESLNLPFDIAIKDNLNLGIDPYKADDFETARCSFFIAEREEVDEIRGYEVE